jgi:hypothetical protein
MEFNEILDSFKDVGIGSLIISILTFIFWVLEKTIGIPNVVSKLFYRIVDSTIKNKIPKLEEINTIKETDILNHDIFNYIDFWMYSQVPTIQFSTGYRTVVFRKYLIIFLQKHKSNLHKWVNDKEFDKMDDSQLWTGLLSLINKIIYDYEREMESVGIPKIIIEKMKVRNNDTISLTIDLLEGVCTSQFYASDRNLLKVYSILNILLSVLENTISSSSNICNSINGQLKGLSMDGEEEGRD